MSMANDNTQTNDNQEDTYKDLCQFLSDTKNNKETDWRGKKIKSSALAESYKRIGNKSKAGRVQFCGADLVFKVNPSDLNGAKKLHSANFCKVRLCPMCAWRRSLKTFHQVSAIMDEICKDREYAFLFLTLTIKNVTGEELSKTLDKLFYGFNRLTKCKEYKKAVKGSFRALEVTHNTNSRSKSYDTYHPHFHCILVVNKSYFRSRDYIQQAKWVELWQRCMGLDYAPTVDIRKCSNSKKSVAEVSKYSVKDADYIIEYNEELTDSTVETLDFALANRRLSAFAGVMREAQRKLKLQDAEDGDLINTDGKDEELRPDLGYVLARYKWNVGLKNYELVEIAEEDYTSRGKGHR